MVTELARGWWAWAALTPALTGGTSSSRREREQVLTVSASHKPRQTASHFSGVLTFNRISSGSILGRDWRNSGTL